MRIFYTIFCLVAAIGVANGALELIGVADGFTFYTEQNIKTTWSQAKEYCRNNGQYLASIDTAAKDLLVSDWLAANLGRNGALWTCGTDEGNEHNYYWDTSGRYFTYENWHFGLGSDPPPIDTTRNCMSISGSNQGVYWVASECNDSKNIVCQQ